MTLSPKAKQKLRSTIFLLGTFAVWEVLCLVFNVSTFVLPRPSQIMITLVERFPALLPSLIQTLNETLIGFALGVIVGVVIGVVIGSSKTAYDVAYPLLVGFSSIPKVAVVPVFVLWFGAGFLPAVLTAIVISIFPIVVNVAAGLATTEPELEDVLKSLGASHIEILWNVGLPRTLPYFFASLKVAITLAFVGSVLSETVAANTGIGNAMLVAASNFDVPLVFAALFLLAFLGVALYGIFAMVERRVCGWAYRKNDFALG
ncbi:MAG TPA: ABC transporter permease [Alphaproteobacteria bacterium]|nr:ABC transporter permease [Alphaproteobacteria bacterium]